MRKLFASMALVALACGGGEQAGESQPPMAEGPAAGAGPGAEQPAGTGTVHEVEMLLTADGQYVYRPAQLTIKAGDTVRWLNVSGFPHNVAFYADQIPQGARPLLEAQFAPDAQRVGPLSGRLMIQEGDTYEIGFAGAPTGTYNYYCTPHEALGMKATLTVTP